MRGVGAYYLKGFRTVGEERSAFTRQRSLVQIQPRPPFSTAFRSFYWPASAPNLSYAETVSILVLSNSVCNFRFSCAISMENATFHELFSRKMASLRFTYQSVVSEGRE